MYGTKISAGLSNEISMKKTLLSLVIGAGLLAQSFFVMAAESPKPKDATPATSQTVKGLTITVGQLINIGQSTVLANLSSQQFPAVTAFRLHRLIETLKPDVDRALKARSDLFTKENSVEMKDGPAGSRTIKPDSLAAFQTSLEALAQEKVVLLITPLSIDADLAGAKLSAKDIDDLGPLLVVSDSATPADTKK